MRNTAVTLAVLCLSAVAGVVVADQAHALSSRAPDTNTGGGYDNSNSRFVLERTGQNTVTSIQVPVYIPNRPTGAVSMSAVDFYYPWSSNRPRVSFQGGPLTSVARNFTIPASSFVEDTTTGYWKAFATAQLENVGVSTYNVAEFRLRVNVSGGLIGIGGGKRYSTLPQNYYTTNNNDTYDYNIPFATPCNVSTNTIRAIALDDLDSGTVDNRWNTITVRVYDETAGRYVSVSPVSGSSMSGDYRANMTFEPGHKYRLRIYNVHANNTLVYTFPYDNIAYRVGCAWSLLGINSQNRVQAGGTGAFSSYGNFHQGSPRTVRPGDVVQFQHAVKNSGNMTTSTFSRWRERNGWQGTSGWPVVGAVSQSTLSAAQTARWPAAPTSYRVQASDVGRTLCERYAVRGQSSTNGNALSSVGSCVRVAVNWVAAGTTTVNRTTAAPGNTITWTHRLVNNGPDSTHTSIVSMVGRSGFSTNTDLLRVTTAAGRPTGNLRSNFTTTYVVTAADLGKTLCQQLKWTPRSSTNATEGLATNRCVTIPYNFNLTPTVGGLNPTMSVAPGSTLPDILPSVMNSVPAPGVVTQTPSNIRWELTHFVVPKGASLPTSSVNGSTPCVYFGNGCVVKDSGTRSFPVNATSLTPLVGEQVGANLPVGSSVCYGLSVMPYADGTTNWRHAVVCLTVGKRPTVQIWGGDVRATGLIGAATTSGTKSGPEPVAFGSWAEYGVFSRGLNGSASGANSMSSGAGLATGSLDFTPPSYHKLTFANVNAAGASTYGSFDFTTPVSLRGQFTSLAPTSTISAATVSAGSLASNIYSRTGNLTIDGGTIGSGQSIIINATGTVTITGDINYANGPYTSLAQLPQLVITAANVHVQNTVKNVDAWLLTTGVLDTCSNVGTPGAMPANGSQLREGVCGDPLVVNGPVATGSLILKRTGGSNPGPDRDQPAELFKLRPDAYMWLKGRGGSGVQAWTTSTTEMPARY